MTKKKSSKLDELKKLKEDFQKKARKVFDEEFAGLVQNVPGVVGVKWTQYAPYFNDGEACEFSVNEPVLVLETSEEDAGYWDLYEQDLDKKQKEALESVSELIQSSEMEDVLKDMFGDDAEVNYSVATGEFTTEHCEHD